jgi:uncharacterized membrane protein
MGTGRLETFSDGVIAVIITIIVLEMKVSHDENHFAPVPAFWTPWLAQGIYALVALNWLVPDRCIERALLESET